MSGSRERERLTTLFTLGLLDSHREERFDRITRLAQHAMQVPIALVSLVDEDRQWFKSNIGLDAAETARDISFCTHAIRQPNVFVIEDALLDARFATNPLVVEDPSIRFYAGAPITAPDGHRIGTLCVIDREPRQPTDAELRSLVDLADLVEQEIHLRFVAATDSLTGLLSRRGFFLAATRMISRAARRGPMPTLVYLDIDNMKAINDTWGHDEGDRVVSEIAEILQESFAADVTGRLGGDEFVVLTDASQPAGAASIERFREHFDRWLLEANLGVRCGVSVGTAQCLRGEDLTSLLERADEAMYLDKRRTILDLR